MCEYIIAEDFKMDKYIFDESNGLWYERQGDYYIPCLTLPAEEEQPVGLRGRGICGKPRSTVRPAIPVCYLVIG